MGTSGIAKVQMPPKGSSRETRIDSFDATWFDVWKAIGSHGVPHADPNASLSPLGFLKKDMFTFWRLLQLIPLISPFRSC